jgi:hypothetical protein
MTFPSAALIHLYSYAEKKVRAGSPANNIPLAVSPVETPEGNGFIIAPSRLRMPILALRDLLGTAFGQASTFPAFSLKVLEAKADGRLLLRASGVELDMVGTELSRDDVEDHIFDWVLRASRHVPQAPRALSHQGGSSFDFKG